MAKNEKGEDRPRLVRKMVEGKMASVVGMSDLLPGAKTMPPDEAPYAIITWDDGSVAYVQNRDVIARTSREDEIPAGNKHHEGEEDVES